MRRQGEQNELHSYEIDERLSESETQATEILKPEKPEFSKTEFLEVKFKNELELLKAERQARQTVLAQMQQQQQQKSQMKGGSSFASKYQPPSFEQRA